jgi:uncharacterized protein (UPF0548 family)
MTEKALSSDWHIDAMLRLTRAAAAEIERQIAAARRMPPFEPSLLCSDRGLKAGQVPRGFAHDKTRSRLGSGEHVLASAKRAFVRWAQFDLGWVRVANPSAAVAVGEIVAVEAFSLGLWSLNLSRIVETVSDANRFGFIYSTTEMHIEKGEERFLLLLDSDTGDVWYELEAVSRPRSRLARLGYPITRHFQHRFARDSHQRMLKELANA